MDATTDSAVALQAEVDLRVLPVALIVESLTNPRTYFDQVKLTELAASIKASGVHQPVLVRPLPAGRVEETSIEPWPFPSSNPRVPRAVRPTHELVAGARRLRASHMAGAQTIPVMIRPLTDEQVLEIQIVENLQRDDLSELEEAEGYEKLQQASGLTVEQIAAKIGKSKAYVYARLKLTALCHDGRKALREGTIDASKALLVARIPTEALQLKALERLTKTDYYGSMSYREAAEYIQSEFMLRLDTARFKITDATLVPEAGACRTCSKRTGADPDLFADVKGADTCIDPPCFRAKEAAQQARMRQEAHERGQTVIDGREAKALIPNGWGGVEGGYLRLDDSRDSPDDKPLRKLIGKQMEAAGVTPTLIANPHKDGELVAVLPATTVSELLRASGHDKPADRVAEDSAREEKAAKNKEAEDRKRRYEEAWRLEVLRESIGRMNSYDHYGASDEVLRHVARHYAALLNGDQAKELCKLLNLGKVAPKEGVTQYVDGHEDPGHALMVLIAFRDSSYTSWYDSPVNENKGLMLVANECDVDIEAVKARTKANQRADEKLAAEKAAAKAQKASTPIAPAAQASDLAREKKSSKPSRAKASPAAAAELPKTSPAHAAAQIAAALQAAEGSEPGAAVAAQGAEASEVPSAASAATAEDQPGAADAAQSEMGGATAVSGTGVVFTVGQAVRFKLGLKSHGGKGRKVSGRHGTIESIDNGTHVVRFGPRSHEVAVASADELEATGTWPFGDAGAVKASAPAQAVEEQRGLAVGFVVGQRVEVLDTATGTGAKFRGRRGEITAKQGDSAWWVSIFGRNGGLAKKCCFDQSELEAVEQ